MASQNSKTAANQDVQKQKRTTSEGTGSSWGPVPGFMRENGLIHSFIHSFLKGRTTITEDHNTQVSMNSIRPALNSQVPSYFSLPNC